MKPRQDPSGPIRGESNLKLPHGSNPYNGFIPVSAIPVSAIIALENEVAGIRHGTVTLNLYIRDGKLSRFTISREQSFMA